jgi:hypothetical protein
MTRFIAKVQKRGRFGEADDFSTVFESAGGHKIDKSEPSDGWCVEFLTAIELGGRHAIRR